MPTRIAINGFGRIGRAALKIIRSRTARDLEIVAINDVTDAVTLAHLLQYDSAYGRYADDVQIDGSRLCVGSDSYVVAAEKDPLRLPWKDLGVDIVLECTGKFVDHSSSSTHLTAGAKQVILSAPAKGSNVPTCVLGVNDHDFDFTAPVISNASCTTNCIAPVVKVLSDTFGITKALMTTVHAYTMDQRLHDAPHKDLRRARAAQMNMIPTTTGAAKTAAHVVPSLHGLFDGLAVRVPVIVGSLADVVCVVGKTVNAQSINDALAAAAGGPMKGILAVTDAPLVSTDIIGTSYSSIVDSSLTSVVGGDLVKVIAWYDNEWGYTMRLVDMAARCAASKG